MPSLLNASTMRSNLDRLFPTLPEEPVQRTVRFVGYLDPPFITQAGLTTRPHDWASNPFPDKKVFSDFKGVNYKLLDLAWDENGGVIAAIEAKYRTNAKNIVIPLTSCAYVEYDSNVLSDLSTACKNAQVKELEMLDSLYACNERSFWHIPEAVPTVELWQRNRFLKSSYQATRELIHNAGYQKAWGKNLHEHFPDIDFSGNKNLRLKLTSHKEAAVGHRHVVRGLYQRSYR